MSYARLRLLPDPVFEGQRETDAKFAADRPSEAVLLKVALEVLARHTRMPDRCYFCLWDGWGSNVTDVPKVEVPHRAYYLFEGHVSDAAEWEQMWPGHPSMSGAHPAFVWPADQTWCLAWDVDPHFAGIGADRQAIDELLADPRVDVVEADPRVAQPRYW